MKKLTLVIEVKPSLDGPILLVFTRSLRSLFLPIYDRFCPPFFESFSAWLTFPLPLGDEAILYGYQRRTFGRALAFLSPD